MTVNIKQPSTKRLACERAYSQALTEMRKSKPNIARALKLLGQAARGGLGDAVNEVARCYHFGIGVRKDRRLSRLWYERAKELGMEE